MSILNDNSPSREVTNITLDEEARIRDFLQGAVYCWCKNRKDEWFSMRDLMGGENFRWAGTPLMALYQTELNAGKNDDQAFDDAGKQSGWLLKNVIISDSRSFETKHEERIRKYRWVI